MMGVQTWEAEGLKVQGRLAVGTGDTGVRLKGRMLGSVRIGRRMLETASAEMHVAGAGGAGCRNGELSVDGNGVVGVRKLWGCLRCRDRGAGIRSGKYWRGAGNVPLVAEKLGIEGVLRLWSPGTLEMLRLKVLGKAVGWAWWVVLSPAPSLFHPQIAKEVAKLLEMKAQLGEDEGKHKFVLKTPKVTLHSKLLCLSACMSSPRTCTQQLPISVGKSPAWPHLSLFAFLFSLSLLAARGRRM